MNPGSRKIFRAKPPDKGSFPLDHDGDVISTSDDTLGYCLPMLLVFFVAVVLIFFVLTMF